jgi:CRP-like cAMP-binding protein
MLWEQITYRDESDIRLPDHLARLFIEQSQKVSKTSKQTLISQSDTTDDVYYIAEGQVRVSVLAPNSKEYIFREIGPGNLIGELTALDGGKRSVMVMTITDTLLYKMAQGSFKKLLGQNEELSNYLTLSLVKRVRNLSEQVFELSTMNVRCRILLDLIRRAKKAALKDGSATFNLPKDQVKVATALATHREAISREYSAFAKNGFIKKHNEKIVVPSIDKLETLLSKLMGL